MKQYHVWCSCFHPQNVLVYRPYNFFHPTIPLGFVNTLCRGVCFFSHSSLHLPNRDSVHVGQCIHSEVLKDLQRAKEHNITEGRLFCYPCSLEPKEGSIALPPACWVTMRKLRINYFFGNLAINLSS